MVYFEKIVTMINDLVWGVPMILLLTGTHLYMTWKTGFVQKYPALRALVWKNHLKLT